MPSQFKPVRFFVLMALAAFIVCGTVAFFTKRAEHGRTGAERAAYALGEQAGEAAAPGKKMPTAAELNMMAQARFEQDGRGDKGNWDVAFENGYEAGFKKTHPAP
jgi:hypothetical protein